MDARTPSSDPAIATGWRPDRCNRVALVLQGGGALGAYQAGVYQALHEEGMEPDWVCGVSIGAHQLGDHCRQSAGASPRAAANLLGPHHGTQGLALHAGRRRLSEGAQPREFFHDDDVGPAWLFQAPRGQSVVQPGRRQNRDQLLRHHTAARDAARAGRLRSDQRPQNAFRCRRRQCRHRQLPLLRQQEGGHRARTCDGERRAAAGASDGENRHRLISGTAASSPTRRCSICWTSRTR